MVHSQTSHLMAGRLACLGPPSLSSQAFSSGSWVCLSSAASRHTWPGGPESRGDIDSALPGAHGGTQLPLTRLDQGVGVRGAQNTSTSRTRRPADCMQRSRHVAEAPTRHPRVPCPLAAVEVSFSPVRTDKEPRLSFVRPLILPLSTDPPRLFHAPFLHSGWWAG